ncbi:hypothetical protein DID76_03985 [Candidatus Marinamargulisbacteria bacterium SCGC AG-414-C22]|nr:hypothetical protein DID76_03985 [Candidatus Marinamargulisbacteria bacterium SCGC AG-414-C22]
MNQKNYTHLNQESFDTELEKSSDYLIFLLDDNLTQDKASYQDYEDGINFITDSSENRPEPSANRHWKNRNVIIILNSANKYNDNNPTQGPFKNLSSLERWGKQAQMESLTIIYSHKGDYNTQAKLDTLLS